MPSPPPRLVGAFPHPLPHVDRHLSDSAALVRLSPPCTVSSLPPPTLVGVGVRHMQIAGWSRASGRRRICPVTHTSIRASVRRAASRTPAQAIVSRGEGRGARPRATDEQLVGVVQGVCALPSRKEGMCCGRRYGPRGRATVAQAACRGEGSTAVSGAGHEEERTSNM